MQLSLQFSHFLYAFISQKLDKNEKILITYKNTKKKSMYKVWKVMQSKERLILLKLRESSQRRQYLNRVFKDA